MKTYAKAVVGALIAGLTALGAAVQTGSIGDVTTGQWITVALAVLGTFAGVFAVPNTTLKPTAKR